MTVDLKIRQKCRTETTGVDRVVVTVQATQLLRKQHFTKHDKVQQGTLVLQL